MIELIKSPVFLQNTTEFVKFGRSSFRSVRVSETLILNLTNPPLVFPPCLPCEAPWRSMGLGGHNVPIIRDTKGIRKLTPRECVRLQGFPESFLFPINQADIHLYKQIGNSVTVPVVSRIAENIRIALES